MQKPKVVIYTDGACDHQGKGGWAASLYCNGENLNISGYEADTTNNRMEMTAVIKALSVLTMSCDVTIFTDSQYVLNGTMTWAALWKRKNWRTHKGAPVQNKDLWDQILELKAKHKLHMEWVKGHNGDPNNEVVDSLAQLARQF